jgi:Fur family zinc uptake transcriptional regulator
MGHHCGHEHEDGRPSRAAVGRALDSADARCLAEGERMTAPRRRVLELLLAAGEPVKAYDLIARYGADGQAAKPPTVYRALEFLERKGMAHRIASISAYVACTAGEDAEAENHAAAFLICDCCGAAEEVTAPVGQTFALAADTAGYAIERTTIEGHGRCPACRVAA